jgi:hypothetical protein
VHPLPSDLLFPGDAGRMLYCWSSDVDQVDRIAEILT